MSGLIRATPHTADWKRDMAATKDKKVLTEAELVKMPESDYMNEAQLDFFRARLHQMERDLLQNAGETTEHQIGRAHV